MESLLDVWIDRNARLEMEQRYWNPIVSTGSLEALLSDPDFARAPDRHLSLFADHSGIHARDVALRMLSLFDEHHGALFAPRDEERFAFMKLYGMQLAFLHDVGMVNATAKGRKMHPQYAAQLVFGRPFDDLAKPLLTKGTLLDRLRDVFGDDVAVLDVRLRELLAMSLCHSKSVMPSARMEDHNELRRAMTVAVLVDLDAQSEALQNGDWTAAPLDRESGLGSAYAGLPIEPFDWLDDAQHPAQCLIADALDTVRVLRVADALRQRGQNLRTSGGFEVFIDDTGHAIFHLASADSEVAIHLRVDSPLSIGEANIAHASVSREGDLCVTLDRGSFAGEARERVARACASVVLDVANDVLDVFPARQNTRIKIQRCLDDRTFAFDIVAAIDRVSELGPRTSVVANLTECNDEERERYELGVPILWPSEIAMEILRNLAARGYQSDAVDPERAFEEARIATARACETLIYVDAPATFVYIPLADGLELRPGAGFDPQSLPAWRQVGATAALRRGRRNSTIEVVSDVEVIMIPGDVFAEWWFHPSPVDDLPRVAGLLAGRAAS